MSLIIIAYPSEIKHKYYRAFISKGIDLLPGTTTAMDRLLRRTLVR